MFTACPPAQGHLDSRSCRSARLNASEAACLAKCDPAAPRSRKASTNLRSGRRSRKGQHRSPSMTKSSTGSTTSVPSPGNASAAPLPLLVSLCPGVAELDTCVGCMPPKTMEEFIDGSAVTAVLLFRRSTNSWSGWRRVASHTPANASACIATQRRRPRSGSSVSKSRHRLSCRSRSRTLRAGVVWCGVVWCGVVVVW